MKLFLIYFALILLGVGNSIAQLPLDNGTVGNPITLRTNTGEIEGTLVLPEILAKVPVVLIIAGSGPTDRNCNNPMMKNDAYKKLAQELAKHNIATVRYDKRGVAASAAAMRDEKDLRFENYIEDAREWIHLLKQNPKFSQVIVLGHSEGSLIGMLASQKEADKFISVAGPGRPADELIKEQISSQSQSIRDIANPIIDSLKKGVVVANILPMFAALFRESVQPYMISWFKYDPAVEIKKLHIPILILQGTNDLQVKIKDAEMLHEANPKSGLKLLDKMNHILRKTPASQEENIATYNNPLLPIDNQLVISIVDFVNAKFMPHPKE